jgi:hypothetical protein
MSDTIQTASGPVDTAKVSGRRLLRFESIDEMMAEVDRLVEAERAGRLKRLGNWTLGQTLGPMPLDEALGRLRKVMERLKTEAPTAPSPALGRLTHDESIAITLRHAELHLGFMIPG